MLIEFHMLQNHAPSNLNRDENGAVKSAVFGGVNRARISSQSQKRAIRRSELLFDYLEDDKLGIRTKYLPERIKELALESGIDEVEAEVISDVFKSIGGGTGDDKDGKKLSSQLIFLGTGNIKVMIDYYKELTSGDNKKIDIEKIKTLYQGVEKLKGDDSAKEKLKRAIQNYEASLKNLSSELLKNLAQVVEERSAVPVDVALFGRMTTNQPIKDVNACCQVAHAVSVNRHSVEFDFFTAVDDLGEEYSHDPGAGHLGDTEFSSACFYHYYSVDFSSLVKTLDDKELAIRSVQAFLKSSVFTTPSGKQNSFASHTLPHFVGVEIKKRKIPTNYCNAFAEPIVKGNWLEESAAKLTEHAIDVREKFSLPVINKAVFKTTQNGEEFGDKCDTLEKLLTWLEKSLQDGVK